MGGGGAGRPFLVGGGVGRCRVVGDDVGGRRLVGNKVSGRDIGGRCGVVRRDGDAIGEFVHQERGERGGCGVVEQQPDGQP
ncbi:hypothetical protein DEH18_17950 [Streptomyces sp. NHF165]|nr:hypothetical protein DEH18_17950 [Streptomyces sp. NHF165]